MNYLHLADLVLEYTNHGTGFIIGLIFSATYLITTSLKRNKVISPYFILFTFIIGFTLIFGLKTMCLAFINKCDLLDNEVTALIFGGFAIVVFAFVSLHTAIKYSEK